MSDDKMKAVKLCILIAAVLVISACETTELYRWGEYESLVYKSYIEPDKATPVIQIEKLTRDIALAEQEQKPYPPGLWAHLGMMYAAVGNVPLALDAFEREKVLFPESTVMIDGMVKRYKESQGAK